MRILMITRSLQADHGWGRYSLEVCRAWQTMGHDVQAVVEELSASDPCQQHQLLESPYRYIVNPLVCRQAQQKITKLIKDWSPDHVHVCVEPYINIWSFTVCRAPLTLTLHGSFATFHLLHSGWRRRLSTWLYSRALQHVKAIFAVSHYTLDHFQGHLHFQGPTSVAYNGLSVLPNVAVHEVEAVKQELSLPNDSSPILCSIGSIKSRKNQLRVIEALPIIVKRYPKTMYIMAGWDIEPAYLQEILATADRLGVAAHIRWSQTIDNERKIAGLYACTDVLLAASKQSGATFEGFGLVVLEANQFGIPAVGSRQSGTQEAIRNGETGRLIDSENAEEIAGAVQEILQWNNSHAETIRAWANSFSWKRTAKAIIAL